MKFYFCQIYKIVFLLFLINIPNLYAHNIVNGGCKVHCEHKVKSKNNKNKLKKVDYEINYEIKISCLNKSLCRGWPEIFLLYEILSLMIIKEFLFAW